MIVRSHKRTGFCARFPFLTTRTPPAFVPDAETTRLRNSRFERTEDEAFAWSFGGEWHFGLSVEQRRSEPQTSEQNPLGPIGLQVGFADPRGRLPEAYRVWDPGLVPAYTATVYRKGGGGTGFANL